MSLNIVHSPEAAPCHTCSTPTHSIIANQFAPNSRVSKRRHCALCQLGPFKPDPTLADKIIVRANGKPGRAGATKDARSGGVGQPRIVWDEASKRAEVEIWMKRRQAETCQQMGYSWSMLRQRWAREFGYTVPSVDHNRGKGRGPYSKAGRRSA